MNTAQLPPAIPLPVTGSLGEIPTTNARRWPHRPVYARRTAAGWADITAAEFHDQVQATARGLIARGIAAEAPVAILAATSYEWTVLDFALWSVGAYAVPVYESSSVDQIAWILSDSQAVAVVAGTRDLADRARAALDEPGALPVWAVDDGLLDALATEGVTVDPDEVVRRTAAVTPEATCTVVYTSGTTGRPKGCVLTHANLLFVARTLVASTQPVVGVPGARTVLFLPLAHVLGRGAQVYCAEAGAQVAHCPHPRQLVTDLADFAPTFIVGVPRIFEKVHAASRQKAHDSGRGRVFDRAAAVATAYGRARESGRPSPWLRMQRAVFDRLVYGRIRQVLGGRLRFAITGGAGLATSLNHFYSGIGLTVMEGYGLTETTASGAFNRADRPRAGTVGQAMPGTGIRIAPDGEIHLRGPQVMTGYLHRADATAQVLDDDGWFATGDLGRLDSDGYLVITGRKKEIIVTAGGKNVSPVILEERIQADPLIVHAIVVGEGRPFIGALLSLDPEALADWGRRHGRAGRSVTELMDDPDLRAHLQSTVDRANSAVSTAESVRAWRLLPGELTEETGHITPSQKLKRDVVTRDFADEVDALYRR